MSSWRQISAALICGLMGWIQSGYAIDEASLPSQFSQQILPYLEAHKSGSFVGKDGISIAWRMIPPANGNPVQGSKAVVVLNGRTEFMRKYAEFAYDLRDSGYTLFLMDHRGQGESGRMLPQTEAGYVNHFRDYIDDVGTFLEQVVQKEGPSEVHLIGHSLGGVIGTLYVIEHPEVFKSVTLTSPMFQPNLGSYPEGVALFIGWFMKLIGHETDLAPGRSLDEWKSPFEGNSVTHSASRYAYAHQILDAHPDIAVGGPTYRWVQEAIRAGQWVRGNAEKIVTPVRILQSELDRIVINSAENDVCSRAKECDLQVMQGSNHEIFMETDPIRSKAISLALDWIEKH